MSKLVARALAPLLGVVLLACRSPDVGQKCTLDWAADGTAPTACTAGADYFETGSASGLRDCENLVCILSPAQADVCADVSAYCSKPCVNDADCTPSAGDKLVCRQVVLDDAFLAALPPATREKYLGQIQSSWYCARPLP